jgi:cytochrome P450
MALFATCMQAQERVVKTLTDYLESRPVTDEIYNKFIQTIHEDSPEDMEEMFHGQGRDLLTGLLFTGHDTTADTMVFTVKYVGENPHVLTKIWVIPSPSAHSCHKIHYSSSSCHGFNCSGFRVLVLKYSAAKY